MSRARFCCIRRRRMSQKLCCFRHPRTSLSVSKTYIFLKKLRRTRCRGTCTHTMSPNLLRQLNQSKTQSFSWSGSLSTTTRSNLQTSGRSYLNTTMIVCSQMTTTGATPLTKLKNSTSKPAKGRFLSMCLLSWAAWTANSCCRR